MPERQQIVASRQIKKLAGPDCATDHADVPSARGQIPAARTPRFCALAALKEHRCPAQPAQRTQ